MHGIFALSAAIVWQPGVLCGYAELVANHAIMKTLVLCVDVSRDVGMFLDYAE